MRRRGRLPAALWLVVVTLAALVARPACAAWCIARSEASDKALQSALDYACGPARGADCAPIQASGLCYLPNTLAAHASYAFNSIISSSAPAPRRGPATSPAPPPSRSPTPVMDHAPTLHLQALPGKQDHLVQRPCQGLPRPCRQKAPGALED